VKANKPTRCDKTIDFVDGLLESSPERRNIYGVMLQADRAVVRSECDSCGKNIIGIKIKRFCGDTCRKRESRRIERDEKEASQLGKSKSKGSTRS